MNESHPPSRTARWIGHILGLLVCANMLFSAGIKQVRPPGIPEHFAHLGWAMSSVTGLGILEFACTILCLIPRTTVLGAILLTAYLGGAAAAHVRVGEGGVAAFPIVLGVLLWGGLWLRDPRLCALLPFKRG